jgi:hypothetical protein
MINDQWVVPGVTLCRARVEEASRVVGARIVKVERAQATRDDRDEIKERQEQRESTTTSV